MTGGASGHPGALSSLPDHSWDTPRPDDMASCPSPKRVNTRRGHAVAKGGCLRHRPVVRRGHSSRDRFVSGQTKGIDDAAELNDRLVNLGDDSAPTPCSVALTNYSGIPWSLRPAPKRRCMTVSCRSRASRSFVVDRDFLDTLVQSCVLDCYFRRRWRVPRPRPAPHG